MTYLQNRKAFSHHPTKHSWAARVQVQAVGLLEEAQCLALQQGSPYNCPTWLDTAASAFRCKGGLGDCSWEEGVPSSPPTRTGITNLSFCATLSAKIGHHILLSLCFRWECDATSVRHACLSKLSPRVEELAQGSASATLGFVVRENLRSLAKRQFSLHSTCTTEACPSAGEAATKSISEVVATNLLARVREGAHSVSVTEQRPGALAAEPTTQVVPCLALEERILQDNSRQNSQDS